MVNFFITESLIQIWIPPNVNETKKHRLFTSSPNFNQNLLPARCKRKEGIRKNPGIIEAIHVCPVLLN